MESFDPLSDEEFWAMARRVRRTADEELAEIEYETERAELKRQDLTSRSMQAMMEGERWLVTIGGRAIEGIIVHVGQNYVGLQDQMGNLHDLVHAAIGAIRLVGDDPRSGRAPITFRPATFRARLLDLEGTREVELAARAGNWSMIGVINSVNSDHLVFDERNGESSLVPIEAIGIMSRSAPDERRGRSRRDDAAR